jgi:hypothetical protein
MQGIRLSPCIFERKSQFKKRKKCAKCKYGKLKALSDSRSLKLLKCDSVSTISGCPS